MSSSKPAAGRLDEPNNVVDVFVGARVRQRRMILAMSQEDLALMAGIPVDTVGRMEMGTERIGVARLLQLSQLLGVPISWFFSGLDVDVDLQYGGSLPSPEHVAGKALDAELLGVLQHCFGSLINHTHKRLVVDLARTLADAEANCRADNSELN